VLHAFASAAGRWPNRATWGGELKLQGGGAVPSYDIRNFVIAIFIPAHSMAQEAA